LGYLTLAKQNTNECYTLIPHVDDSTITAADKPNRVLDFTADWCYWCQLMDRKVWPNQTVKNALLNYKGKKREVFDINTDVGKAAAKFYDVRALPTVIIVTHDGKEIFRRVGYTGVKTLSDMLNKYKDTRR